MCLTNYSSNRRSNSACGPTKVVDWETEWAKQLVQHHQHVFVAQSVDGSGAGGTKSHLFRTISRFLLFDLAPRSRSLSPSACCPI